MESGDEAACPSAQPLQSDASKTNDLHFKRLNKLIEGFKGPYKTLANTVKLAPLGDKAFFKEDLLEAIKEAPPALSPKDPSLRQVSHPSRPPDRLWDSRVPRCDN